MPTSLDQVESLTLKKAWQFYMCWPTGRFDCEAALCIADVLEQRNIALPELDPSVMT